MTPNIEGPYKQIIQTLLTVNRLQLKAFNAESRQSLTFIILNDTYQVFAYDRALLWDLSEATPKLLGISGMHKVYKESELSQKWTKLLATIKNPEMPQALTAESFSGDVALWDEVVKPKETVIYWIPIKVGDKLRLGLSLEMWKPAERQLNAKSDLEFLEKSVVPAYGSSWAKFDTSRYLKPSHLPRTLWYGLAVAVFAILLFVRVPLRIASPCEVVPMNPIVITAPLDGIIKQVTIKPGQYVHTGDTLLHYDKTIPLEELEAAQKQVQITEAELNKASTLGLSDPKPLADLQVLQFKLEKDQLMLQLARTQATKLDVKAPENGIVMIDDPDAWRGKPVRIGEKIMTLSNSTSSKIKISIPESDNIPLDKSKPISIILNVSPGITYQAKLTYIANESSLSENQVVSFSAEANWETPPKDVKLGLRGTAILYGENVSLFYFIARKPWSALRRITEF